MQQTIDYPLRMMIDVFEFPDATHRDRAEYPKVAEVRYVKGYRRR